MSEASGPAPEAAPKPPPKGRSWPLWLAVGVLVQQLVEVLRLVLEFGPLVSAAQTIDVVDAAPHVLHGRLGDLGRVASEDPGRLFLEHARRRLHVTRRPALAVLGRFPAGRPLLAALIRCVLSVQVAVLRPCGKPGGAQSSLRMAWNAPWGISTLPTAFRRFLPFFCFSSSLRLRLMSPP